MRTVLFASGRVPRLHGHPMLLGFCIAAMAAGCGSKQKTPVANPADTLKTSSAQMGAQFDRSRCDGCHLCVKECPTGAITGSPKARHEIDQLRCTKCGNCLRVCPQKRHAVSKVAGAATATSLA